MLLFYCQDCDLSSEKKTPYSFPTTFSFTYYYYFTVPFLLYDFIFILLFLVYFIYFDYCVCLLNIIFTSPTLLADIVYFSDLKLGFEESKRMLKVSNWKIPPSPFCPPSKAAPPKHMNAHCLILRISPWARALGRGV